jgi:hypothetical protein
LVRPGSTVIEWASSSIPSSPAGAVAERKA